MRATLRDPWFWRLWGVLFLGVALIHHAFAGAWLPPWELTAAVAVALVIDAAVAFARAVNA